MNASLDICSVSHGSRNQRSSVIQNQSHGKFSNKALLIKSEIKEESKGSSVHSSGNSPNYRGKSQTIKARLKKFSNFSPTIKSKSSSPSESLSDNQASNQISMPLYKGDELQELEKS